MTVWQEISNQQPPFVKVGCEVVLDFPCFTYMSPGLFLDHRSAPLLHLQPSTRSPPLQICPLPSGLRTQRLPLQKGCIIHPIKIYCSPFSLNMSTLFYQLAKIIHKM